uniref:Uncharacterized protein n=1 Tax=Candidatus Kentrum sp. DK TaxID=2126562 RepID=A0A450SC34_9GAMM|nr:MAG: hypothetical protein BECKDK2373C_GA0170839_10262 [Candidatus Kentron sp. DK]VFJ49812.1 MAG: hypothetical protein BECKDK2373B_GA0170837_102619 [Candidatus Kentron sp. DK]
MRLLYFDAACVGKLLFGGYVIQTSDARSCMQLLRKN